MDYTLDHVYPDDYLYLTNQIEIRTVTQDIRDLAMLTNPHLKPSDQTKLSSELLSKRQRLLGRPLNTAKLDVQGLQGLKRQLGKESRTIGVK